MDGTVMGQLVRAFKHRMVFLYMPLCMEFTITSYNQECKFHKKNELVFSHDGLHTMSMKLILEIKAKFEG